MRVSKSALVVLSALALLTACQKEPEPTPPPQAQEQAPILILPHLLLLPHLPPIPA